MHELGSLLNDVKTLFERELKVSIPSDDVNLFEQRYLDSLRFVDILVAVEQEFDIEIPLEELDVDSFRSIREAAKFIAHQRVAHQPIAQHRT